VDYGNAFKSRSHLPVFKIDIQIYQNAPQPKNDLYLQSSGIQRRVVRIETTFRRNISIPTSGLKMSRARTQDAGRWSYNTGIKVRMNITYLVFCFTAFLVSQDVSVSEIGAIRKKPWYKQWGYPAILLERQRETRGKP
jgi:hypothetical protein